MYGFKQRKEQTYSVRIRKYYLATDLVLGRFVELPTLWLAEPCFTPYVVVTDSVSIYQLVSLVESLHSTSSRTSYH